MRRSPTPPALVLLLLLLLSCSSLGHGRNSLQRGIASNTATITATESVTRELAARQAADTAGPAATTSTTTTSSSSSSSVTRLGPQPDNLVPPLDPAGSDMVVEFPEEQQAEEEMPSGEGHGHCGQRCAPRTLCVH
jgi:hypothetical protein